MIKRYIQGEHVITIVTFLAIIVMGARYVFVSASDFQTVSTGEKFQVESLAQYITPLETVVPPKQPVITFDRSLFQDDLVFAVRRGDTMQTIARRAIRVFLDEQHLTFEPWQSMAMEKIIAESRSGESLRGKKTVTFTHDEIAQAFEGIGEQSQKNKDALTLEAENVK